MPERLMITVTAGGEDADARTFMNVLGDVLNALDALAKAKRVSADWRVVALQKSSPATVTLGSASHAKLLLLLLDGMKELESGVSELLPPSAIRPVKRLAGRVGKSVDRVDLEIPGVAVVTPTPQMAKHAELSLRRGYYKLPSSIDGTLEIVNVHATAKFSIFDDVDNREIKCSFGPLLLEKVRDNIGRRVTAIGVVKYNRQTDLPISIVVDDIESLENDDGNGLPALFSDMPGIDVAGSLSSEEYVRRLRDGK